MRRKSRAVVVLLTTTALMLCAYKEPPKSAEEIFEPIEIEEEPVPLAVGDFELPELLMEIDIPDKIEEPVTTDNNRQPFWTEPIKMRITCYVPTGNKTADGTIPYEGICAAKREWMGKTAIVYDENMRYVGVFEIRDTGGHERIKNGTSIDIFRNTLERCYEYERMNGMYGYVQVIDAEG